MAGKTASDGIVVDPALDLTSPFQLYPKFEKRVWGRESLDPYFDMPASQDRIGEAWLTCDSNPTSTGMTVGELLRVHKEVLGTACHPDYPGVCPLLVKFLFTSERLSVQVHPEDDYARQHHQSLGKTEAWYVLDAKPPGEVALGLTRALTKEELKRAAQSEEIEKFISWRKVHQGDVLLVPAGTVHAIGAGLTICEIQENSDITYRLYDWGRPRELHLDHGVRVSTTGPYENGAKKIELSPGREELVACKYFRLERLAPRNAIRFHHALPYYAIAICVDGKGRIGEHDFTEGQAWFLPAGMTETEIVGSGSEWLFVYASKTPTKGIEVA